MGKGRLEAFSDGVLAIIITIMVLELKVPHEASWEALSHLAPVFLSYVLSFVYVGIYWNNHHHMLHAAKSVNGAVLWANMFLLFWLSLIPFVTAWMGENHFAQVPVICYGVVLVMNSIAYLILMKLLIKLHGENSVLARAVGSDTKGKISTGIYAAAIVVSFIHSWIAFGMYFIVALIWLIPDTRIERRLAEGSGDQQVN
ncbi:TMEM175 family protein [Mucilaginibacter sp. AK015]|uniref:TMEM175 family protein n=1 Tax=Mucilaginibacter sp. AK015 TaxID=2723072 RepID=UPI00160E1ACD|nr:TMEM175 family protein [Mucilaginibacter sp. AK015]MBB5394032.1 putative membrane protein [Mucilaginibacter sp. AK015]